MTKLMQTAHLRLATYNIHKARGLDGRVHPDRIIRVLSELNADVIALQEVVSHDGKRPQDHQARYIADALGFHMQFGENRLHNGGAYGNVLLSRLPIQHACNHDISIPRREPRGCLRTDLLLPQGGVLHLFNLHLGTSFFERRHQARKLFHDGILISSHLPGSKIILGDLNEWTKGLASRLLRRHFYRAEIPKRAIARGSYPGIFPLLNLDHIYFDRGLELRHVSLHRSRTALVASDHLPLVAEFLIPAAPRPDHWRVTASRPFPIAHTTERFHARSALTAR
jgi:endonuclease/exonuclease/phosphatase family metal-dependent hydrolase